MDFLPFRVNAVRQAFGAIDFAVIDKSLKVKSSHGTNLRQGKSD